MGRVKFGEPLRLLPILERQDDIKHLLPVTGLLNIRNLSAPAIGNSRLGDLGGNDCVIRLNVFGPDNAADNEFAHFEINADLLAAFDYEIAVRQKLGDDSSDIGCERL